MIETSYADEVRALVDSFEHELCDPCGYDLEAHSIAPDMFGHARLYCLTKSDDY